MRRERSLTLEGALQILGKHEHRTIEKINKLLGGVILGSGAAAGLVALGVTPLAPLAVFGVVWGWVEQKGLAVELLKSAVEAVSGKLAGIEMLEKRELIAAAHSTIVVAAIFESLREHVGKEFYAGLEITDEEKISVIHQMGPHVGDEGVKHLYAAEIPAPSAACGFEDNISRVERWQVLFIKQLELFIRGLAVGEKVRLDWRGVAVGARECYRSQYLELAAKVPEFAIWAQLGEHAATREAVRKVGSEVESGIAELATDLAEMSSSVEGLSVTVRESNADIVAALDSNRDALNRVAALFAAVASHRGSERGGPATGAGLSHGKVSGLCMAVSLANAGILRESIIPADPDRYPAELTIPMVSEIYVNPRYRVAEFSVQSRPADDQWWDERPSRDDFDILLAAHVTSPAATRLPLVILGHPGAGKSLLTKVFAARLPDSEFTVVRVPLRRVSADARIHRQIEDALEISTGQRIAWSDLAQQSADKGRVVLLDGLDELLQASEHDRSRYLEDVVEFQEREADQRRPVVVVVTSRTVVADRVRIPDGTIIVKLDPYNDDDIADWVARWKQVNADAIAAGTLGELTLYAARRQPELAEQPLLLLMLALYAADLILPQLDEDVATAELYRRLLEGFARREAAKDLGLGHDPSADELDHRVQDHLERLAIAALGMFNRGQQDISEEQLGKDLETLAPHQSQRSRAGQRIIGEFFFVYAPEARTLTRHQTRNEPPRRAYEFLHATFGEYLVARRVMDELLEVAETAFASRRGRAELHDDMLFALLSHQVVIARLSMLDFAREIFVDLLDEVASQVLEALELLLSSYQHRHGSDRYTAYRPAPPDQVRQLACYSANLTSLRILLEPEIPTPLTNIMSDPQNALQQWQSTVTLWKSSLDSDALRAMIIAIELTSDRSYLTSRLSKKIHIIAARGMSDSPGTLIEVGMAHLAGDRVTERNVRYGAAVANGSLYLLGDDSWIDVMSASLIPQIIGQRIPVASTTPTADTPESAIKIVARLIFLYLRSTYADHKEDEKLLRLLFEMPAIYEIDTLALSVAVMSDPGLRDRIPQLGDLHVYGRYADIVDKSRDLEVLQKADFKDPSNETVATFWSALVLPRESSSTLDLGLP